MFRHFRLLQHIPKPPQNHTFIEMVVTDTGGAAVLAGTAAHHGDTIFYNLRNQLVRFLGISKTSGILIVEKEIYGLLSAFFCINGVSADSRADVLLLRHRYQARCVSNGAAQPLKMIVSDHLPVWTLLQQTAVGRYHITRELQPDALRFEFSG